MKKTTIIGLVIVLALFFRCADAQTPAARTLSYQGLISGAAGPLNGSSEFTVTLYADPEGRQPIWTGSYKAPVNDGTFNLELGDGGYPLPSSTVLDREMWLGISVDGTAEMRPYTHLSTALKAITVADGAVTNTKLAVGAVTADKIDADYISSITVNGQKISGKGTPLNILSGGSLHAVYDETTNSLELLGSGSNTSGSRTMAVPDRIALSDASGTSFGPGAQGTSTSVLHGNASGAPSYSQVSLGTDVTGTLPISNGGTGSSSGAWLLSGNTLAAGNFLGSTNAVDVVFRVNAGTGTTGTALRLISQATNTNTPSVIGGHESNTATGAGDFIGGGGYRHPVDFNLLSNTITTANNCAIAGGAENGITASTIDSSDFSFIGAGLNNHIAAGSHHGVIGGGRNNNLDGLGTAIAGGDSNEVLEAHGFIGGGELNLVSEEGGAVVGGSNDSVLGPFGFVGGGINNVIYEPTPVGAPSLSVIAGGFNNHIHTNAPQSTIAGGSGNEIDDAFGTIAGGAANVISYEYDFIGGGLSNYVGEDRAAIGGGEANTVLSLPAFGTYFSTSVTPGHSGVFVGDRNLDYSFGNSVIAGGSFDTIYAAQSATIAGGISNYVGLPAFATTVLDDLHEGGSVGGGKANLVSGDFATIPGGRGLIAQSLSQTVIGQYNLPLGSGYVQYQSVGGSFDIMNPFDPLFIVGNGQGPKSKSNAFEVTDNGHSIVFDNSANTSTAHAVKGGTYTDNVIYAWGNIDGATGNPVNANSIYGSTCAGAAGVYTVTVGIDDPHAGPGPTFNGASMVVTPKYDDQDQDCYVALVQYPGTGNIFTVHLKNLSAGGCLERAHGFTYIITGRP